MKHGSDRTYSLLLKTNEPRIEPQLNKIFEQMEKEFGNISFDITIKDKRFIPFELVLDITIRVASGVAAAFVIKLLEKLWEELSEKKVIPDTKGMDDIQNSVERYLEAIGVGQFKTLQRKDKGPYVVFIFEDEKGGKHRVVITSFDFRILDYRREESVK